MFDLSQILNQRCSISRVMNGVAAGTSDQTSSAVDMQGFEGCLFIFLFGALTATQVTSIKAQQSSDDAAADDYTDLEGTASAALADADGNKMIVLDIYRPEKRYLKVVIDRGTANAVIDGIVAIKYGAREVPTTHASSVKSSEAHVTPAEGTA